MSRVASILHSTFIFNPKSKEKVGEVYSKIKLISREMEGFRKSFEYIEDYINIPGLRLWQEEISRIINHAVEKEAAGFLKNAGDSYNQYQSLAVPIPEFPPVKGDISRFYVNHVNPCVLYFYITEHLLDDLSGRCYLSQMPAQVCMWTRSEPGLLPGFHTWRFWDQIQYSTFSPLLEYPV